MSNDCLPAIYQSPLEGGTWDKITATYNTKNIFQIYLVGIFFNVMSTYLQYFQIKIQYSCQ